MQMPEVKKKYRQMSLLVHPDKNQHDPERAQKSFEAVNKAFRTLDDDDSRKKCQEVVEEAREMVHKMMEEKRNKLRKAGKSTLIEEDEHAKYKHAIYCQTCKLFADLERLRVEEELKQSHERLFIIIILFCIKSFAFVKKKNIYKVNFHCSIFLKVQSYLKGCCYSFFKNLISLFNYNVILGITVFLY
ncbi:unnamed protein product [Protopolystoma xenopodis]|uniref:J domain-containing protein n=1 Tax=Protopolystoma xenopodis TaxID=117903 RepID=A0A3S4ZZ96_9PLAT|nr:unnamed protein product [Protopolystoma xenopodis]